MKHFPHLPALIWLFAAQALADSWQDPAEIRSAALEYALSNSKPGARVEATVEPLDPRLRLRRCSTPLQVREVSPPTRSGHSTLVVHCTDAQAWALHVPVRLRTFQPVVVMKNAVLRGTILRESDLELRELDTGSIQGNTISDLRQATGKIAIRSLAAGTAVTPYQIQAPLWVRRGETVTVRVYSGGLQIRTQAEALADGSENQSIRARNTVSGKIFDALVVEPGVLQVRM